MKLTNNLHGRQCGGGREKRGIGSHFAWKVARETESNIAYEYLGGIRAGYLLSKNTKIKTRTTHYF